jgi:hypothetical protein
VIELYDEPLHPCPAQTIDALHKAIRKVGAIDLASLRAYVARLRENGAAHGPAEKFLPQRLEGLGRLGFR